MCDRRDLAVLFDGSFEGFLCVIYAHFYEKVVPLHIQTEDQYQQTLDSEEYFVATDLDRAYKVHGAIRKKISSNAERYLLRAYLNDEEDKFLDMFKYTVLGFKVGAAVDSHLQQDCVLRVHKLAMNVSREGHLLTGFCRFAETTNGVYYCAISPKNRVLPILAEHFCDRLMNQAWVIHDKTHFQAAVYDGNKYIIADAPRDAIVELADTEEQIQDMWVAFFNKITIKERMNYKCQRTHLPLWFRKNMLEFKIN